MSFISPLGIGIILHYYAIARDYRDGDFSAPAVKDMINRLLEDDILEPIPLEENEFILTYRITERGRAYVNKILSLEYPVQVWV